MLMMMMMMKMHVGFFFFYKEIMYLFIMNSSDICYFVLFYFVLCMIFILFRGNTILCVFYREK